MTSFKIMEDIGLDSIQDNETYNYESYKQTFTNLPYNSKEFQITKKKVQLMKKQKKLQ